MHCYFSLCIFKFYRLHNIVPLFFFQHSSLYFIFVVCSKSSRGMWNEESENEKEKLLRYIFIQMQVHYFLLKSKSVCLNRFFFFSLKKCFQIMRTTCLCICALILCCLFALTHAKIEVFCFCFFCFCICSAGK